MNENRSYNERLNRENSVQIVQRLEPTIDRKSCQRVNRLEPKNFKKSHGNRGWFRGSRNIIVKLEAESVTSSELNQVEEMWGDKIYSVHRQQSTEKLYTNVRSNITKNIY